MDSAIRPWRERALLVRIQTKHLELATPFCWSVAQLFDVDASGQAALDSSSDQLGGKKSVLPRGPGGGLLIKSPTLVRNARAVTGAAVGCCLGPRVPIRI